MKIHDISLPLSADLPVWPGDPAIVFTKTQSITNGDACNVTEVLMGVHSGTHIDAPYHFYDNAMTVDAIAFDHLIGPCFVVDLSAETIIGRSALEKHNLSSYKRVLIKTRNSELWANKKSFAPDFTAIDIDAAGYLLTLGCVLVGLDYLSIEAFDTKESPVHKLLLGNNVVILEGLNLSEISSGEYELICMPLPLQGCDGAPARVVLIG